MKRVRLVRSIELLVATATLAASCGPSRDGATAAANNPTGAAKAPTVEVVRVVSQRLNITVRLPGELWPYEVVAMYPKVTGFVDWIGVDRGSRVRTGQLIARLVAPEIISQRAEAQAKVQSAEAQRVEAEAKLAADESTYQRLEAAAATPGVVSGNDLEVAQKTAEADRSRVKALEGSENAAKQALRSVQEIEEYLRITAPFDGVVTERNVHPGALVGPAGAPGVAAPMVRIQTIARLRLAIPVPETYVAGIAEGDKVAFTVPPFPGETFAGTVARIAHAVDIKTRTMPVELDVANALGRLAPGTFSEVLWPVRRPTPTLFVQASAVMKTTERTFVIRVKGAKTEWVDVKTGASSGSLIEVFGDLRDGDYVAIGGTDELRPGTAVVSHLASSN